MLFYAAYIMQRTRSAKLLPMYRTISHKLNHDLDAIDMRFCSGTA